MWPSVGAISAASTPPPITQAVARPLKASLTASSAAKR